MWNQLQCELLHLSLPTEEEEALGVYLDGGKRGVHREANAKVAQKCVAKALMWCLQ